MPPCHRPRGFDEALADDAGADHAIEVIDSPLGLVEEDGSASGSRSA